MPPDDNFLDRVKRAYRRAIAGEGKTGGMWADINRARLDVHEALLAKDNSGLRAIFSDPGATDLFHGADGLCRQLLDASPDKARLMELSSSNEYYTLFLLARAVTDQGPRQADFDVDRFLSELDRQLRQSIRFPNPFPGEHGFPSDRGIASYRPIQALYQTWRLLGFDIGSAPSVIEIGPGLGRAAFYGYSAGLRNYTTIDLPLGMVAQACFLGAVLGSDALWFEGENDIDRKDRIGLLTSLPRRNFDIAVNVDSMTEMTERVATQYLAWINRNCGRFYSINHGLNSFTVSEVAKRTLYVRSLEKRAHPMRFGYTEEFYRIQPPNTVTLTMRSRRFLSQVKKCFGSIR